MYPNPEDVVDLVADGDDDGFGMGLVALDGLLVYVDIPKSSHIDFNVFRFWL